MNINLLHHWLVSLRGGEKVLEQLCHLFPTADIHTLVQTKCKARLGKILPQHDIHTTGMKFVPGAEKYYKSLLPFFPTFIQNHKIDSDFILSSDASLIKGMKKDNDIPHVCYCHSPPRYLWDMQEEYLNTMRGVKKSLFKLLTPYLRHFDLKGADNVDHFIANSHYVKKRIERIYGRKAEVVYPPVALDDFEISNQSEDYYLIVSALVPYKRVDLAVKAFNALGKRLIVIGEGSELHKLKSIAKDNVQLIGSQPFDVLMKHYQKCKAFIFPGIEDFGITPLEAQASGKPVIAYKDGGALETVIDGETGLFFEHQTVDSLKEVIEKYEILADNFSPDDCRKNAENFNPSRFRKEIKNFLIRTYPSYFCDFPWGDEQQDKSLNI